MEFSWELVVSVKLAEGGRTRGEGNISLYNMDFSTLGGLPGLTAQNQNLHRPNLNSPPAPPQWPQIQE